MNSIDKYSKLYSVVNREDLVKPNCFVLGMPRGGMTFSNKREIMDVFKKKTDDCVIIDPEGDYKVMTTKLGEASTSIVKKK